MIHRSTPPRGRKFGFTAPALLLLGETPHAVPVGRRRRNAQRFQSLLENAGWPVIGLTRQALGEAALGGLPITGAVGGEACGEQIAQLRDVGRQLAAAAN